jgi:lipoprotein signal peptidase
VIGGMFVVNFATLVHLGRQIALGLDPSTLPFAQHWMSLATVLLYFPGLIALWFVKSRAANIALLTFMIALLLGGALGSSMST